MLFYSLYLNAIRQEIRNEIADGTSKLTISVDDLNNYLIEYIPINTQEQIANEYKNKVLCLKKKYIKAQKQIDEMLKTI